MADGASIITSRPELFFGKAIQSRIESKPANKEKLPDRSEQPPAYDLAEDDEIGMVECTVDSILNQ